MKKLFLLAATIIVMAGCKTTKMDQKAIIGQAWQLQDINGVKALESDFRNGMPTITFAADNRVSGKGGCNGYGGEYTLSENGDLTVDRVISTKMFCEGVNENEFMAALARAKTASIENGNLVLAEGNTRLLVFAPKAGDAK